MFAQLAVRKNRENHDVAGSVVGNEEELAGFVEGEIAGIFAQCGKLVQLRQFRRLGVESERRDRALLPGLVGRIHKLAIGMNSDP